MLGAESALSTPKTLYTRMHIIGLADKKCTFAPCHFNPLFIRSIQNRLIRRKVHVEVSSNSLCVFSCALYRDADRIINLRPVGLLILDAEDY